MSERVWRHWREHSSEWLFLAIILGLTLYRVLVIEVNRLELDVEEAYYLHWSLHPAWGYFSKPPMIAWLLAWVTDWFGRGELAIKSVSLVLHMATALLVFSIGKHVYNTKTGIYAGLVFYTLPLIGGLSLYTSTDAPLHFFWALTVRFFLNAMESNRLRWWLLAGLSGGLGLLSKYTMGVLAIGLCCVLLVDRQSRRLFASGGLWAGLVLAVVVWLPNVWWNIDNNFISYQHTVHISQLQKDLFHIDRLFEFWVGQGLLLGPVFAVAFVSAVMRRSTWDDERHRLLLLISLPIFVLISIQALLAEAHLNWASPTYIGLSVVIAAWLRQRSRRWLKTGIVVNLLLLSGVYHLHALADSMGIELSARVSPYHSRMGWRDLGEGIARWLRRYPDARLVSNDRRLLAYMTYYAAKPERPLASWRPGSRIRSQFDLEGDVSKYPNDSYLFISSRPLASDVLERFSEVRSLGAIRVKVFPDLYREVHGYLLSDFKGYDVVDTQGAR